ncbi:hypothetical protein AC578_3818 [Pseudocercospora eumusae]|uniref:Uncharacterized protein n=1 Tax=Pseudocercospora eumusae TaxID=321146 RepID=A0A139HFM4_9PEZI|nr:hypothetical protein AC578_3818 [Pseudocercospora eumusae]
MPSFGRYLLSLFPANKGLSFDPDFKASQPHDVQYRLSSAVNFNRRPALSSACTMGGRRAANSQSPAPVTEPETPKPEFTKGGIIKKKGKHNLAVIKRYGMLREDQWEDRKQLLKDRESQSAEPDGSLQLEPNVQQRLGNICTQLAAIRDLLNLEDLEVVNLVVATLSSAVRELWELTGEVTGDNPGDFSSPVVLNSS